MLSLQIGKYKLLNLSAEDEEKLPRLSVNFQSFSIGAQIIIINEYMQVKNSDKGIAKTVKDDILLLWNPREDRCADFQ